MLINTHTYNFLISNDLILYIYYNYNYLLKVKTRNCIIKLHFTSTLNQMINKILYIINIHINDSISVRLKKKN